MDTSGLLEARLKSSFLKYVYVYISLSAPSPSETPTSSPPSIKAPKNMDLTLIIFPKV